MKQVLSIVMLAVTVCLLASCASIVNGTNQSVSVHTGSVTGARCELANDKGKWYVNGTPGSVVVHRSYKDLNVVCHKKGIHSPLKHVVSKTKGMTFGNAVFGGVIGVGVDVASGAAYDYPNEIFVPMQR